MNLQQTQQKQRQDFMIEFAPLFENVNKLAYKYNQKDVWHGGRGKEYYISYILNHAVGEEYTGADAYDKLGACEYKTTSTNHKSPKFRYNFNKLPTWKEQMEYLENEKILPYKNHYMIFFDVTGTVSEVWKLKAEVVLELLLKTIKSQYLLHKDSEKVIDVALTPTQVREYGEKVNFKNK